MIKLSLAIILIVSPLFSYSQWTQMGNDINGTADGDKLGSTHSIDIDSTGTTIAFGTAFNSDVFSFSGYAKVLDWDGNAWNQRGTTFVGLDSTLEGTGSAVSLSADGMTVAISSPWGYNSLGYKCGIVRVFDWDNSSWVLRGDRIDGEGNINPIFSGDVFGTALELSSDGNYIVIGARANTPQVGANQLSGHTRIYHWNGSNWIQVGQDIDGDIIGGVQELGYSVSINDAGDRVAIGARSHSGPAQSAGLVRMFEYNGASWVQMGTTLFGSLVGEYFGSAVQMTRDGNSVAIGIPGANGTMVGATKILDWNGNDWIQRGSDINAIGTSNSGQSIDLSHDGNIIAIGEPWSNSVSGGVRVFEWNGNSWSQVENDILSTGTGSSIVAFGSAVRMNAAGTRVVVGAPSNDGGGFNLGEITVHQNGPNVGIKETKRSTISIHPNPTQGVLNFSDEIAPGSSITIYNSAGIKLKEIPSEVAKGSINLDNLPDGFYLISIVGNNFFASEKFTIQR